MAQQYPTDRGSKIISGSAAFSSAGGDLYEVGDDRTITLTVQASPSIFIAPGVAGGASVAYVRNSIGDESFSQIGFGPHLALFLTGRQRDRQKLKVPPILI
ncbi:MAG TPA: hypothetical protein PKW76_06185 [bacterium]|nr:hypothetical protein [bacterium]HPG45247.1 hypothetical protein [bacterium]HPM99034.1 hypothetical protein [bacterium]